MKTRMAGFQKPLDDGERKPVGLAIIKVSETSPLLVGCSCGWTYGHVRSKVREDAIDRHLNKNHDGRGIRL